MLLKEPQRLQSLETMQNQIKQKSVAMPKRTRLVFEQMRQTRK
nr:MAG TPA: hypothetical protein [Caudoviricetes sp.]